MLEPGTERFLQLDDQLHVLGPVEYFTGTLSRIGEELTPEQSTSQYTATAQIVVISKTAVGKTLEELELPRKFGFC